MRWIVRLGLSIIFCFITSPVLAADFFVSPQGSSTGLGTLSSPWDLQTALNHPTTVRPGDTIYLRGGRYTGSYSVRLKGTSAAPIHVKAYQSERAILDGERNNLVIRDTWYTWFWGLEITYSANTRDPFLPQTGNAVSAIRDTPVSHDLKFINMIIHDTKQSAYGWYESNYNSEIYGNVIYFAGTKTLDHGIYVHNATGNKWISDNIIGDPAGYGIHGYGGYASDGTPMQLNGIVATGNIIYKPGSIGCKEDTTTCGQAKSGILVGGLSGQYAENTELRLNATYTTSASGGSLNLGYSGGSRNGIVTDNYFMGGIFTIGGSYTGLTLQNNSIYYSSLTGIQPTTFPNNTWLTSKPAGTKIIVRPNRYDPNRAHVAIYNWNRATTVQLTATDLAALNLRSGDVITLINTQDYFQDRITTTFTSTGISVPMTGRSVALPIGATTRPTSTFPEFGAFVLLVTRTNASPSPTLLPGDANRDGVVDGVDYMIWRSNYNQLRTGVSYGDFDNSGRVDGVDYMIWRSNYGR